MTEGLPHSVAPSHPHREPTTDEAGTPLWRRWLRARLHLFVTGILLIVAVVVYFWNSIFIVIHAGEAGVLWNRFSGTRIDRVYSEGLHVISPLNIMRRYEVRKQIVKHELDVLSVEGLRLHLELAIRFQPEYSLLGMLHENIGPDYLLRVVIPQTESVLRKQLGNATAEQIYTNEGGLLTRSMLKAMAEVGRNFVEVEDVIIRSIRLPDTVRDAIEAKLRQQQLFASYEFRRATAVKEAERKRIEAAGISDYQGIIDETLSDRLLAHQGIEAARTLAESNNEKTLVVGAGSSGIDLPIFLGNMAEGKEKETPNAAASDAGKR